MTMGILAGKLATVTGAGSGIGRAVCKLFALEGAKVVVTDENVKAAEYTAAMLQGTEHLPIQINVKNLKSIENTFNKIRKHFSVPPTVIVNCAGITRDNFLLKLSEQDFDCVVNTNLKGTFLVTQCAVKEILNSGIAKGGSIVNLASISGKNGNIGQGNYAASKAGVEALTKTAALEFGQYNIRVNAVLPGFIETQMTSTIPQKVKDMFIERVALKRIGKPIEVAELILFLASEKSSYINGASIEVSGGMQ